MKKKNCSLQFVILLLLGLFLVSSFFSCSDSLPQIDSPVVKVVFDYESAEKQPALRLSVFSQITSPVSRAQSIVITHEATSLRWELFSPDFYSDGQRRWFGSSALCVPVNMDLPAGTYTLTYTDLAGQSVEKHFLLSYPNEAEKLTYTQIEQNSIFTVLTQRKLVVYDSNQKMLYFGASEQNLITDADILRAFPAAASWRLYCFADNPTNYSILGPKHLLQNK